MDGSGVQVKTCTACGDLKDIHEFHSDKSKPDGRRSRCKVCTTASNKASAERNRDAILEGKREYYQRNKEKIRAKTREWVAKNPDLKREMDKRYAKENKDRIATKLAEWKAANPGYMKEWYAQNPGYDKNWRAENADKVRAYTAISYARKKDDPEFKVSSAIRAGVVKGVRKGSKSARKTFDLLGYTLEELMTHLEIQFLPGMTWDNYGEWHIDHIIPVSAHNYQTPDDIDFQKCWALSNLRPLWAADNIRKGAKLDVPFQPSLAIPANDNTNPMMIGKT